VTDEDNTLDWKQRKESGAGVEGSVLTKTATNRMFRVNKFSFGLQISSVVASELIDGTKASGLTHSFCNQVVGVFFLQIFRVEFKSRSVSGL
jgi:hypothetical protein